MMSQKIIAPLQQHLVNLNTIDYLWDSNVEVMENMLRDISKTEVYIDDMSLHQHLGRTYECASHSTKETTR